jgi:hypothetical protein
VIHPPPWPRAGTRIANGRGVPGTLGAGAICRHDGTPVLLSSYHVLFGGGAAAGEPVWSLPSLRRLGSTLYGRLGNISHNGHACYVDCAVARIGDGSSGWPIEQPPSLIQVGAIVRLDRGVRGMVIGVRDIAGTASQILVRPLCASVPFSAAGDSGAVLRNQDDAAVGLVWGMTPGGETIACPLDRVLDVLGIDLIRAQP